MDKGRNDLRRKFSWIFYDRHENFNPCSGILEKENSPSKDSDELDYGILNTLLGKEDDCSPTVATGVYFSPPFGTSLKP